MQRHSLPSNPRVEWDYITREDMEYFYGPDRNRFTVQGLSFYLDGKLAAIAGAQHMGDRRLVFMQLDKDVKVSKVTIWRCAGLVMDMLEKRQLPLCTIADTTQKTAIPFLERLGFLITGHSSEGPFLERLV